MTEKHYFDTERSFELSDGTKLYYYNTDEYKKSELDVFFALPLDKEMTPLVKLMLAVLFRGSQSYPTLTDMSRRLDMLYDSSLNSHDYQLGANHINRVRIRVLDKKYLPERDKDLDLIGEAIDMLEDILLRPLLDENGMLCKSFIDAEREFAIDGINARLSSPKSYAAIRCGEMLFEGQPEGVSMEGTEDLLMSFTAEKVSQAREYFLKNSHVTAYYVGTDSPEHVASKLGGLFSKICDRTPYAPARKRCIPSPAYREITEEFELNQGVLRLGLTADTAIGDGDFAAWLVYNEILGGSSTSKLFMNVREKKSLCYYCHSMLDVCTGAMAIACGIKPENKDDALNEINEQLAEMKRGNITANEISYAKKGIISSLRQTPDSTSWLGISDYRYRLLTDTHISIEKRIADTVAVTLEDIVRVAKKVRLCSVFFLTAKDGEYREEYEEAEYEQDN